MVLAATALLIPIVGFIMMLSHARAGETRQEQRWRKGHGLVWWVLLPGIAGGLLLLGYAGMLPSLFSVIGILLLSGSATMSYVLQRRHEASLRRF